MQGELPESRSGRMRGPFPGELPSKPQCKRVCQDVHRMHRPHISTGVCERVATAGVLGRFQEVAFKRGSMGTLEGRVYFQPRVESPFHHWCGSGMFQKAKSCDVSIL